MARKRHPQSAGSADFYIKLLPTLLTMMSVLAASPVRAAGTPGGAVPKIVVNILVDQLRSDYLEAFMPLYGNDGFKRLLRDGVVYTNVDHPLAHPDIASTAATIASGTAPSSHGVVGRMWLDRETLRPTFCVDDTQYTGTGGTTDQSSARCLSVSTISDELKAAGEDKPIVFAIAPSREAAILTAGHAANAAVWIDDKTGRWSSTNYYGALPAWAAVRNTLGTISDIDKTEWRPCSELVGNFSYFLSGGVKKPFTHKFKGESRFANYKTSALVNEEINAAAKSCINSTMIGADPVTDYLAITYYAGQYAGQNESASPMELQDTYVRLDQALAELIATLDQKAGIDNVLLVLTSSGYATETTTDLSRYRIPTGTFDMKRTAALLNMYLVAIYGQGQFVEACYGTQIYLDHKLIEKGQFNLAEMLERSQDFLMQLEGVKDVYTSRRLLQGAWTPGISKIRGGYNPRVSGDILIEVAPGWQYTDGQNSKKNPVRESYIPYPIIFFGGGLQASTFDTAVTTDRIAPTLSKAMRIRAPNACSSAPLF